MDKVEIPNREGEKGQNTELIKRQKLGTSMLEKVTAEGKHAVVLGRFRITEWFDDEDELNAYISTDWDFNVRLITTMIEAHEEAKRQLLEEISRQKSLQK